MLKQMFSDLLGRSKSDPSEPTLAGALQADRSMPLHLGCGGNVIPGWTNIDLEPPAGAMQWDLTKPLPFESGSRPYVFNEHFIEHIDYESALQLVSECFRVLKVGGVFRVSTPDLRKLISEYLGGGTREWADVGWIPDTPCRLMNEGMRMWGHTFVYDEDEMRLLLARGGFREVVKVDWRASQHTMLRSLECRPYHSELIFEATKT